MPRWVRRWVRGVCTSALLTVSITATALAANPPKKLEDTVNRFYKAYIHAKWKTASKYVESQSREMFLAQPKPGIQKYKIIKIQMQKGGREAVATVGVDMPVMQFGKVMTLKAQSRWRLSGGHWRMFIEAPPPIPAAMAGVHPTSDHPTADLKFDHREFNFGTKRQGDTINIRFPFVNATSHPVKVTASLVSTCHCIEVGVTKQTVAPGEQAAVWFKLNSKPFTFNYHQGIGVKVEPGGGSAILDITGFLLPAAYNPPDQSHTKTSNK